MAHNVGLIHVMKHKNLMKTVHVNSVPSTQEHLTTVCSAYQINVPKTKSYFPTAHVNTVHHSPDLREMEQSVIQMNAVQDKN